MGAIFVAWMVVGALPPPPTDDGLACQKWAVDEASALIASPQPPASPLGGDTSGGLSDVPDPEWVELGALGIPESRDGGASSWRSVKEGTLPVASVPEIQRALTAGEQRLRHVLLAARGPSSTLSDPWQVWCVLDCPGGPSVDRARYDVPTLALSFGWQALERGRVDDAVLACVGLAGFLRAIAGTHLLGQMLAAAHVHPLSLLCTQTARRVPSSTRRALATDLALVEGEWPAFSHTLRQELVFGQMTVVDRLPSELRVRVPERWLAVSKGIRGEDEMSWTSSVRSRLFGGWALRERCLELAALVGLADNPPSASDARFEKQAPTLLSQLAWEGASPSSWIGYLRRVRKTRTELRMLGVALRGPAEGLGENVDARTGRPLEVRGAGADRVVVAVADPAFGAEELRLPVPGGTPSRP